MTTLLTSPETFDQKTPVSEVVIRLSRDIRFISAVWVFLFILTITVTGLDFRSLMSAFLAWCGGLVTARLSATYEESKKERNHG
jgi:hypothetical protein